VTVSRREDEELMAFLDGELPPRDAREVEARIDASAATRLKVEALGELSTLVRTHYEQATSAAEPSMAAAWAKLEAQLGNAPAPAPQGVRTDSARSGAPGGWWQAVVDAFTPRWSHIMTGAIGVAAGALLVFALRPGARPESAHQGPVVAPVEPAPVVTASAEDTNVDDLDVQSGTGMVFQVPNKNANMPATTVIWVTDDSPTEGPI
jgi:anti-sigma factor RsiW